MIAAVAVAWEFLAMASPPDALHLTLTGLAAHYPAFRALVYAGWLALGLLAVSVC